MARRYLRATVAAVHLLKTDPARAQAIFGKYTETTDPAILEGAYQVFAAKTDAIPYVRAAAVQTAIAEVAQEDRARRTCAPRTSSTTATCRRSRTAASSRASTGSSAAGAAPRPPLP